MTNREYIETLSNEKIAEFISENISDCGRLCPIRDYCDNVVYEFFGGCYHVWLKWLKDEHKEVKE